ncbi:aldo/keto reductase, putative [Talaromyces stipitatus ATCC 10500]|uniref:Aldo/keto reductase, putative n=1 Tax=Talaromyces stipitatus (strain ATCC 10500 / CBS 375.48 / QM 6759 / NRRL 1006) TaxID=441959 RepID=B8MMK1_TALSN|nr:aldo/keto reductase, putative [Talaromyces stipitatus ATCC 10500]EED13755.1 aldo/keto reductase, putative [Talaromyces stipitatus ATCC 10500]
MTSSSVEIAFARKTQPNSSKYLSDHGIQTIDTAEIYLGSEELLGAASAVSLGFTIDTKVGHGAGGSTTPATKENVIRSGEASLNRLKTNQVDVYYIHGFDQRVPLKDTLEGINELYKKGVFKRFGLSNFSVAEIEDVVRISKERGFVLPTVYEGNYNAINHLIEKKLFSTIRKYNMVFHAYSPIAGGLLAKTPHQIKEGGQGRWDINTFVGKLYYGMYNKPNVMEFLEKFGKIATTKTKCSQAELAYRWIAYHSRLKGELGDKIIGARYGPQLTEVLDALGRGPLSAEVVEEVNGLWDLVKDDPPAEHRTILEELKRSDIK